MRNNGIDQTKIICIDFSEKRDIDGCGLVWAAEYEDYGSNRIIIVPDERFFVPGFPGTYLAIKPKGYKKPISYFEEYPVYKAKVFNLTPEIKNNIAVYRSDFFIPVCFMKKNDCTVVFRPSTHKNKNEFALIWINNELEREKSERYLKKNISFTKLRVNSLCVIEIEAERGEKQEEFEKKITQSINYCKG